MAPQNRGPQFATIIGVFLSISWIFAFLRFYVRIFLSKNFGVDDYFFAGAIIFFTTYCSTALMGIKYGTGQHVANIPASHLPHAIYFWWLCEIFYNLATLSLRISVAVLLRRLCVNKKQLYVIYFAVAMVSLYAIYYLVIVVVQCDPPNYMWNQYDENSTQTGTCLPANVIADSTMVHSIVLALTDWILGCVPIFMLWSLQMSRQAKMTVGGVLSLGIIAGIGAIIRMPYVHTMATTGDFLYATTDVAIWSTIEPSLGIVAASGATLRPLFKSLFEMSGRSTGGGNARTTAKSKLTNGYLRQHDSRIRETELDDMNNNGVMRRTDIVITYKDAKDSWSMSEERLNSSTEIERDREGVHDGTSRRAQPDDAHSYDSGEKPATRAWAPGA